MQYVKLYNEFINFIILYKDLFTDIYERKIINLFLNNFDKIAELEKIIKGNYKLSWRP